MLFELRELKRGLTHILYLDMQLEPRVFLKDGSVWTVGLWMSHTPLGARSLQPRRSASTIMHTNTQRGH